MINPIKVSFVIYVKVGQSKINRTNATGLGLIFQLSFVKNQALSPHLNCVKLIRTMAFSIFSMYMIVR